MERAYEKRDIKLTNELSHKIESLEKTLGPEYVALVDRLGALDPENDKLADEITSLFEIAPRNTGAITFGRYFEVTSIWSPPLCSGVQSTFVSHLNRVFWLFYSHFVISYLVYIKSFTICVQAQIICAENFSIAVTPYVFYWIT